MAETENDSNSINEEEVTEREIFMDSETVRTRARKGDDTSKLRHPRQRYCHQWESQFNWLRADKIDESLGICVICDKSLVCKKSHLERHQNSFKHQRLSATGETILADLPDEELDNSAEHDNVEFLECYEENFATDDMEQVSESKPIVGEYIVEMVNSDMEQHHGLDSLKQKRRYMDQSHDIIPNRKKKKSKIDRSKLLQRIERERNALNECYYTYQNSLNNAAAPAQSRDSFDLFFESVCASAKNLPPKLGAEMKSSISKILTEFEIRAICEKEAQQN